MRCRMASAPIRALRTRADKDRSSVESRSRTTRSEYRYGCFRQDLTGLANATSARLPCGHMAKHSHNIKVRDNASYFGTTLRM